MSRMSEKICMAPEIAVMYCNGHVNSVLGTDFGCQAARRDSASQQETEESGRKEEGVKGGGTHVSHVGRLGVQDVDLKVSDGKGLSVGRARDPSSREV